MEPKLAILHLQSWVNDMLTQQKLFCLKASNKSQTVTIFTLFSCIEKFKVIQMLENIYQVCKHWRKTRRFESMQKKNFLFLPKLFNFYFALKKPCQNSTFVKPSDVCIKQENRSIIIKIIVKCFEQPVI